MQQQLETPSSGELEGEQIPFGLTREMAAMAFGTDHRSIRQELGTQLALATPCSAVSDKANFDDSISAALAMLSEIAPRDTIESMAAVQMITIHNAAMDAFRRAIRSGQISPASEMYLRRAERLSSLFDRLSTSFDRRRGRGQQTIRVEHVNASRGIDAAGDRSSSLVRNQVAREKPRNPRAKTATTSRTAPSRPRTKARSHSLRDSAKIRTGEER